jgi:hypothetical protein
MVHALTPVLGFVSTSNIPAADLTSQNLTPWSESTSELYLPSDRRLSAKLVPKFADIECEVISVTDLYGRILGSLDRNRYFFLFQ